MQAAADFHALPAVERDRGYVAGEDVQERDFAARHDLARDGGQQDLPERFICLS